MIDGIDRSGALMTATDLLTLRLEHKSTELVRGKLVVREPPSTYHGRVQSTLNFIVVAHVRANALGAARLPGTGDGRRTTAK